MRLISTSLSAPLVSMLTASTVTVSTARVKLWTHSTRSPIFSHCLPADREIAASWARKRSAALLSSHAQMLQLLQLITCPASERFHDNACWRRPTRYRGSDALFDFLLCPNAHLLTEHDNHVVQYINLTVTMTGPFVRYDDDDDDDNDSDELTRTSALWTSLVLFKTAPYRFVIKWHERCTPSSACSLSVHLSVLSQEGNVAETSNLMQTFFKNERSKAKVTKLHKVQMCFNSQIYELSKLISCLIPSSEDIRC